MDPPVTATPIVILLLENNTPGLFVGGYYVWCKRPESQRQRVIALLRKQILLIYNEHNGMIGSPMLTSELRDEPLFQNVSQGRVARHTRALGLRCKYAKKFVPTTDSAHTEPVAPNLIDRNFTIPAPNMACATDITYLKVGRKWHYLTVVIDLYSRMVVGWELSDSLERHSVIHALKKAVTRRNPSFGLLIHSYRGVQYTSKGFPKCLKKTRLHSEYEPERELLGQRRSRVFFSHNQKSTDPS